MAVKNVKPQLKDGGQGGQSGINVIDLEGIVFNNVNEGFYNNIKNSFNEELPSYIKNFTKATGFFSIVGLVPVIVDEPGVVYEGEDHEAITFYFMCDSETFTIQVLDNDYVRMFQTTLVEEEQQEQS